MNQSTSTCAAADTWIVRVARLFGVAMLVFCSAILAVLTRPLIEGVTGSTYLQLGIFVAALGMLASSIAAFWLRGTSLRRMEWAAYVGLGLLLTHEFMTQANGGSAVYAVPIFGLLVFAVVIARITRRTRAATCNCS